MEPRELVRLLTYHYHAMIAANPDWDALSLLDYLLQHGLSKVEIWKGNPQLGIEAGWDEPEWL